MLICRRPQQTTTETITIDGGSPYPTFCSLVVAHARRVYSIEPSHRIPVVLMTSGPVILRMARRRRCGPDP